MTYIDGTWFCSLGTPSSRSSLKSFHHSSWHRETSPYDLNCYLRTCPMKLRWWLGFVLCCELEEGQAGFREQEGGKFRSSPPTTVTRKPLAFCTLGCLSYKPKQFRLQQSPVQLFTHQKPLLLFYPAHGSQKPRRPGPVPTLTTLLSLRATLPTAVRWS